MKFAAALVLCCQLAGIPAFAGAAPSRNADLNEIARVATIMVDGDVCQSIVTPRAMAQMLHPNPRDEWAAGDNYDVNAGAFNSVKKTLMRLAMMVNYPVDVNLWMPVPTTTPTIQVVIRNKNNLSQFWDGQLDQKMPAQMDAVLKTGQQMTVQEKPGMISVLAPVRNSLGQIVGLVEVVSSTVPPKHDER